MKTTEPASLTIRCFCRRCGRKFDRHLDKQTMQSIKATIWLTIRIDNWEDFECWQKKTALCKDCIRKLREAEEARATAALKK
jgi:hypothetical protein